MRPSAENKTILIVDDTASTIEILQRNLTAEGYRVFTSSCVMGAIEILGNTHIDLVVTDLKMPKVSGLDLVRHVRENYADTEVIMITGYPSLKGAVEAIKKGAEEYLAKPFTDEELLSAVQQALDKLEARRSTHVALDKIPSAPKGLVGASEIMQKLYGAIEKAASTSATALIVGESGAGKELVARAIHYSSKRSAAPFVPVNCGGIPEGLIESELFGHIKGAFTGAIESRAGFFHTADGGTIFLDEISEMSLSMQVKLLRVLQDKEISMIGSDKSRKVNVRILAATNKDMLALVKKNLFREDLFYRLNVITILCPPLRERGNDILLLVRKFAEKFAQDLNKTIPTFSDDALRVLQNYYWPGNVRELENVIQRLVVMSEGDIIDVPDLPSLMRFSALRGKDEFTRPLAEVEAEYVRNVLASVHENKTRAARILGIDRKTLREKMNRIANK